MSENRSSSRGTWGIAVGFLVIVVLVSLMAFLLGRQVGLERAAPPIEEITVERVELPEPGRIRLHFVNGGVDPVTINQVIVDDALWAFEISPGATVARLGRAVVEIPYPWVEGEAHEIVLISRNGVTFDVGIDVATETPSASSKWFLQLALLGFYVGIVPVTLGLATYPFLRRLGSAGVDFLLALTVGLLVFLAIDTLMEALDLAGELAEAFHGPILVWIVTIGTVIGLVAVSSSRRRRGEGVSPIAVSGFIALGIGLHNLGEGLAIGAALANGAVGLGTFLIVGFTLHNITEGVGIAAPLLRARPRLGHFGGLALLAGGPAIVGAWIGGMVFNPLWGALFLAVGAGAILQVIWEVSRLLSRGAMTGAEFWRTEVLAGAVAGVGVMYLTALIIPA